MPQIGQTGRKPPTTTERGLGSEHMKLRRELLPLAYGKPCRYCGFAMAEGQLLELDHVWPRVLAGPNNAGPRMIVHRSCNRRAGAILGNKLRAALRRVNQPRPSRW